MNILDTMDSIFNGKNVAKVESAFNGVVFAYDRRFRHMDDFA